MNRGFFERGGGWVIGQFTLLSAVAGLGLAGHGEPKPLALALGGWVFLAASALCGLAGALALGRNLTPFPRPAARAQLVQRGIYGWIRHPLYTAVICAATGWSLLRASWPALAVSLALAVFLDAKARHEERWLRQQFPDYARYEQRVRRFLPCIY
jgi:protein-S-isoprenylcysteine O-methyltransferase Ste14